MGRRVELVFDPFDLTDIEVRFQGRSMGKAIGQRIGHHVHHKARPEATPTPAATGIDYLRLVQANHTAELAERLRYAQLPDTSTADVDADADEQLRAELAGFAALAAQQRTEHTHLDQDREAS